MKAKILIGEHIDSPASENDRADGTLEFASGLVQMYTPDGMCSSARIIPPTIREVTRKHTDYEGATHKYRVWVLKFGDKEIELGKTGALSVRKVFESLGLM